MERSVREFKWLIGTHHVDDEDHLLYETTRITTRQYKGTDFIIAFRALVLPDCSLGKEEREPIHAADILKMTLATPGQSYTREDIVVLLTCVT